MLNLSLTVPVAALFVVLCACGSQSDKPAAARPTEPDSVINPIVVRVVDKVLPTAVKHLTEELRIQPGPNDASAFSLVSQFVVDRRGAFWIYDDATNTIFVFDSAGRPVRKVGRSGRGPGEFRFNGGLAVLGDGRIAQWDDGNGRISFFSATGDYQDSWSVPRGAVRHRALRTDDAGALYVKRTTFKEPITEPNPREREGLLRVRNDGGVSDTLLTPDLHIPAVMYNGGSQSDGDMTMIAMIEANYTPRALWDWHPRGFFVMGHGARYEITLYRTTERPLRIERAFSPVAVAKDEREDEERAILGNPSRQWKGPPLPLTKPPLFDLHVAKDGRIWAQVPMPSVRTEEPNPDTRPGRPAKVWRYSMTPAWEVYSATGEFLGRVEFPPRTKLMQANGDRVWAMQTDDDGLPGAVRFRIEPPLSNSSASR